MVHLESYVAADSVENYCTDPLDGDNVEAVFSPASWTKPSRSSAPFRPI